MNKVEKVSIGKIAFTLDQNAYKKINEYLDELGAFYSSSKSGSEIMDGIEERMAELLTEKLGCEGIVTEAMADSVIATLGRPEQIENETSGTDTCSGGRANVNRRLYRNPCDKIIGGVCGGLGEYFHADPVIFRLLFAFSTILLGAFLYDENGVWPWIPVIIYILLWICVPQAKTVRQRCEMRGQDETVNGIKDNVNSCGSAEPAVHNTNNFWHVVGRIVLIFIGIVLFIIGVSGIAGIIVGIFGIDIFRWLSPGIDYQGAVTNFYNNFPYFGTVHSLIFTIPLFIFLFIPFVAILYLGLKLIFAFKAPSWRPGLIMLVVWGLALIMLIVASCIYLVPFI